MEPKRGGTSVSPKVRLASPVWRGHPVVRLASCSLTKEMPHNLSMSPRNRSSFHIVRTSRISFNVFGVLGAGEVAMHASAIPAALLLWARTYSCATGFGLGANNLLARASIARALSSACCAAPSPPAPVSGSGERMTCEAEVDDTDFRSMLLTTTRLVLLSDPPCHSVY